MSFFPYEPPYENDDTDDLLTKPVTQADAVAHVAPEAALHSMLHDQVATLLNRLQAAGLASFTEAERNEKIVRLSAHLEAALHADARPTLDDPRREQQVAHMLRWLDDAASGFNF